MIYHLASKMNDRGDVSALCYTAPRAIPLKRGHSWVLDADRVTCSKCKKLAAEKGIVNALVGASTTQPTEGAGDAR